MAAQKALNDAILERDTVSKELNVANKAKLIVVDEIRIVNIEFIKADKIRLDEEKKASIKSVIATATNNVVPIPTIAPITIATPIPITDELENVFRYKIMMEEFFDENIKDVLIQRNKDLYKNKIFNSKEFNSITDRDSGVIGPDEEIKKLIDNIGKNENTIENIVNNHAQYLHNRVGTLLNENEKKNIMKTKKDFEKGDLVAYNDTLNEQIAIYMDTILSGQDKDKMKIIRINRKDKKNIMSSIEIVDSASLSYITEEIKQTFKPNLKLADDDLIETYSIDF
jgi:hypothetical protein